MKNLMCVLMISFLGLFCTKQGEAAMQISSPAFNDNQEIPSQYTCQGQDINPALEISDIPDTAQTLALIVDDPDAPMGTWVHWVVFNIPAGTVSIAENSIPGKQAGNDFGRASYGGPCPPSGTHRYFFKLYALDTELDPVAIQSKADLEKAMQGHILAEARVIGLYKKK